MSWQRCPICEGKGFNPRELPPVPCDVCGGRKIISTLTGLPPQGESKVTFTIEPFDPLRQEPSSTCEDGPTKCGAV